MESVLKVAMTKKDFDLAICGKGSGPLIGRARNQIVQATLQTEATHLWFVDTDVVFEPDIIDKLIRADKPIVSAHYMGIRDSTTFPVGNIKFPDGHWEKASYKTLKGRKGVREVTGVGMGCTLIKREVLEALGTGPLWPFAESLDGDEMLGEDITFCVRAGEKGFSSWLHLDAKVGHLKTQMFAPHS